MGAVIVKKAIYEAFMQGPEGAIELFHGYTYSAHPTACAAGLATLGDLRARRAADAREVAGALLGGCGAFAARPAARHRHPQLRADPGPGAGVDSGQGRRARVRGVHEVLRRGLLVRQTGDILALSPPLIVERPQIDQMFGTLAEVLKGL